MDNGGISVPLESKISNALVTMQSESFLVMGMQWYLFMGFTSLDRLEYRRKVNPGFRLILVRFSWRKQ